MTSLLQASTSSPKPGAASTSQSTTTEYIVRAPNDSKKRFNMIKFSSGTNIDFLKLTNTSVKMERENNQKEFKTAYNIDTMPKFGAGSEYGRDQKEEARRKKFGIRTRKYISADQPWMMKVGKGKDSRRYKGVREGTITENTAYYIFTQCADGAFEAFPVEEWYNFQPLIKYKYLNSEEAEEEFSRRDKTMNYFSVMVRNRIKNEDKTADPDEGEKKVKTKKGKKDKSLILTDMDDWAESSEEEEEEEQEGNEDKDKAKKEKKKEKPLKLKKNSKHNDNDEAIEESDEGDFDDRELDYISDSGSESDLDERDKDEKYDDKGVDQEKGLKKLIDSEEESSEDEEKKEEENEEDEQPEEEKKGKKKKKEKKEKKEGAAGGEDSDSSSSSSESDDSDIEKNEDKFSSVLFMQKKKGASRSNTPTFEKTTESSKAEQKTEGVKRKIEPDESPDSQKKMRTESPVTSASQAAAALSGEITEEAIRRYLMRKPMTAKELVQKFKSKKPQMSKDQMTQKIGQLLKKINPERKYVNNILYLSVKKTD